MTTADFLIIGGGIVGLAIARELKRRFPDVQVTVLEKEPLCGAHASGRNSGVIHAGFYYSADSLKARLTRAGNRALRSYCEEMDIPINQCGKLVVARDETELEGLDELLRRGAANGVPLENVSEDEARRIEPRAKTCQRAIYSPTTASADPRRVIEAMRQDAVDAGIAILNNARYLGRDGRTVRASCSRFEAGHVVNAAGLYADRVALDYGFSERYRILPFKGLYLYSDEPPNALHAHIYPVPDLRNPFLGVHFTLTADGHVKIGPTAIPGFWREQYRGFDNFKFGEFVDILFREAGLVIAADFDFRRLALEELKKLSRRRLVELASFLVHGVRPDQFTRWGEPGIRAQLLDIRSRRLEMDFVVEGDEHSTHVLNAVSPAWTCALPFAQYIVDRIDGSAKASQPEESVANATSWTDNQNHRRNDE